MDYVALWFGPQMRPDGSCANAPSRESTDGFGLEETGFFPSLLGRVFSYDPNGRGRKGISIWSGWVGYISPDG